MREVVATMKHAEPDNGPQFPFDVATITGVRIESSPWVIPVDSGTAEFVTAGGETWLHWEQNGLQRAVNNRHIVEVFSHKPKVIDLTEPDREFAHQLNADPVAGRPA